MRNQEQNSPDVSKINEKELGDYLQKIVEKKMKGYANPTTSWLGKFSIPCKDVVGEVEPNRFLLETKEVSNEDYNKFFFSLQKQERRFWIYCDTKSGFEDKKPSVLKMVKIAECLRRNIDPRSCNINVGFLERGIDGKFKLVKSEYYPLQDETEHNQKMDELEEQHKDHCDFADSYEDHYVVLQSYSENEWTVKEWEDHISIYYPVKEM